jgi:hypothetical protein
VPSKTAGPKNALAHGLYASDLVLAWENEQDFVDLHESIRQELNPVGSLELGESSSQSVHNWRTTAIPMPQPLPKEGWQGVRTTCRTLAAALTLSLCACAISSKQQLATLHELLELIKKRTAQMSSASAEYKPKLRRIPQPDGYDLVETIGAEVQALCGTNCESRSSNR